MKEVGERLNLKGHKTGAQNVQVYGPGDIEAHLGKDNKFYVLDFGRVFPPEAPNPAGSRKIFYCLLRPEFVRNYPIPLSSDAFSCWGKNGGEVHNPEVIEATIYLYDQLIPKFAIELANRENEPEIRLTEMLHANGINCRQLGRVRRSVPSQFAKTHDFILNEMLARTLTSVLRQLLRLEMQKTQIASQEPYKILVLEFFNSLLSPSIKKYRASIKESQQTGFYKTPAIKDVDNISYLHYSRFWTRDVKSWLNDKFEFGLSEIEMHKDFDLRKQIDMVTLIQRICRQSGIKLSKHALAEFRNSPENFKLLNFDLRKVSAKIRHLNVIDEAEGNLLYIEASSVQGREGLWEATNQCYARAVASNTNNPGTYIRWGCILMDQCSRLNLNLKLPEYEKLLGAALEKFNSSLKIDNKIPFAYFESSITLLEQAVTMQLFRSGDTIAISLWMINQAQEALRKAFYTENARRSLLFPTLIERAYEIYKKAKAAAMSEDKLLQSSIYFLKSFYMIHCAIATAPFLPEPSVFQLAGVIVKEYLTSNPENIHKAPKFLFSLAGSYLESSFLTHPSCSDGEVIYYQTKSDYQRKITNTNEILPSYYDDQRDLQSKNDIVIIYERKENQNDHSYCSYISNEEIIIPKDTPLHMLPVITSDPTNDYHGTIGINRILHVLGNETVISNIDICAYNVYNGINQPVKSLEEDLTPHSFYKTSWIFLLNHSGFHQFLLTHMTVKYPKNYAQSDNQSVPKQVRLYGSNSENIINLNINEIQEKLILASSEKKGIGNEEEILFFIFSCDLDLSLGNFESRMRQSSPAKYLILEFVPPSPSVRSLVVSAISLRGHQCYTPERKDSVTLSENDMMKLRRRTRPLKEEMMEIMKIKDIQNRNTSNTMSNSINNYNYTPNSPAIAWSPSNHSPRVTFLFFI